MIHLVTRDYDVLTLCKADATSASTHTVQVDCAETLAGLCDACLEELFKLDNHDDSEDEESTDGEEE